MTKSPKFSNNHELAAPPMRVSLSNFKSPPFDLHKANASHID